MEKLSFAEVLALAKNFYVDFDCLLTESNEGGFVDKNGRHFDVSDSSLIFESDFSYDRISAYIKILQEIKSFRPLPF